MCPACITTVALIVAGATSTGGAAVLVVKKRRARNGAKNIDPTKESKMDRPKLVSQEEWLAARKQHLKKEKEFTRLRAKLSAERHELPWVKVENFDYHVSFTNDEMAKGKVYYNCAMTEFGSEEASQAFILIWRLCCRDPIPTAGLSAAEQRAVDAFKRFQTDGFGYFLQQSTRPQTIGYALADSPVGQAAWIYEKFHNWTDYKGDPESALTRDEMLDNITLYCLTDTAASSARIYFEYAGIVAKNNSGVADLPVGCSIFSREIVPAPRGWAERFFPNLIHWNEIDRGGHFAAFEQPALFTKELRDCFRSLR